MDGCDDIICVLRLNILRKVMIQFLCTECGQLERCDDTLFVY